MIDDFERCYRAVSGRDQRFDGWFFTAVTTTGIYCRPSCPAVTPKRDNVRFFATAAAAQNHGFRSCRRCRPDAVPGSPEWNTRSDVVARAMRLIADGVVDRDGVSGLARRLGYSERQLHRHLVAEVGTGALSLARAQRAHTARLLIETTGMPMTQTAFAAGFRSVRQFNDTIAAVFGRSPSQLRQSRRRHTPAAGAGVIVRLAYRRPFAGDDVLRFFAARAVPGVEEVIGRSYRRTLRLPHAAGTATLSDVGGYVACRLELSDLRDLAAAVQRCRRMLDLDADPVAVDDVLRRDPLLAPSVDALPGLRVPGTPDPAELAVRAVIGQQVSVAGARTLAGRLTARYGKPLNRPDGGLTHVFPEPAALADADLTDLGIPRARGRAIAAVAARLEDGGVDLDVGADRAGATRELHAIPGVGPWTASYIAMRGLRDPDAFPATDLGLRKAARRRLGIQAGELERVSRRWRPWRAYAAQHLWSTLEERTP